MEVNRQSLIIADYHSKQATTSTNDKSKKVKDVPDNLVKVPDVNFKTKEHVQALFSQAGLKVEFVPKNFDHEAKVNTRNIYIGDSYLDSQPNLQYLDSDEYGDNYGYYAPKGSTIVVGYTDHDYYYKDDKIGEDSQSIPSSTSSSSSPPTNTSSSENPDLNEYAIFLQDTINDFVAEYRVTVYQKEGGAMHVVFPQDIKYESTAHLQAFSDAMLEVHRSAFYLWSAEKNFSTTNGGTDIPIFYMDSEDGTRIAEYSVLSGKMKVKIRN
ncbi:hypothetical protein ACVR05_02040 [Streptococcus caprae]